MMQSLATVLVDAAERFPDHPATVSAVPNAPLSLCYRELLDLACRGASTLRARGLDPGDRVVLALEPRPEWAAAFFAVLGAELTVIPVAADTDATRLTTVMRLAQPAAVIASSRSAAAPHGIGLDLETLFASRSAALARSTRCPAGVIAFTSGSTSHPRAVVLTHANLRANLRALLGVRRAEPQDAFLSLLPPWHLFELMVGMLGPLSCGSRIVYPGTLLPHRLLSIAREHGITHALCVPALLDALYREVLDQLVDEGVIAESGRERRPAECARSIGAARDGVIAERIRSAVRARIGSSLRVVGLGGAAVDPSWATLARAVDLQIEVGYGLTEAGPVVTLGNLAECPPGSVGRPLPGIELRTTASGEIRVNGPSLMKGYLGAPDDTRRALAHGWLNTGDVGRMDERGYLTVLGRCKEAMVTDRGMTIYPEEIEPYYASRLFTEHCVIPVPGANGNDRPTLVVVSDRTEREVQREFERCRAAAPPEFRIAEMIRAQFPLPRTAAGKLRRRAVAGAFHESEPTS